MSIVNENPEHAERPTNKIKKFDLNINKNKTKLLKTNTKQTSIKNDE